MPVTDTSDQPEEAHKPAMFFPQTRWSMVVQAGPAGGEHSNEALEQLCRVYWMPLYMVARSAWELGKEDAEDLTQGFFEVVLHRKLFEKVGPGKGRLRTYLQKAFENFHIDWLRRTQADKRGGGRPLVSFDWDRAETLLEAESARRAVPPEQAYDRGWALSMLEAAVQRLESEWTAAGKAPPFAVMRPFLDLSTVADADLKVAAREAGMEWEAFRKAVQRQRQGFGGLLRDMVADTLDQPTARDVEDELRAMMLALQGTE